MLQEGSLMGGLKARAFAVPEPPPTIERSATTSPAVTESRPVAAQQPIAPPPEPAASRLDPVQILSGSWPSIQSFVIGLNLAPAGIKQNNNPFIDRLSHPTEEDPDATDSASGNTLATRPVTPGSHALDEDPFAKHFDLRF